MLFTREQLEGLYYLMVGVLLLVGIPLFCERFHSGGDDGGEGEALWADAGAGVDAAGSAGVAGGSAAGSGGSGAGYGDGSAGGSGSGSFYDDSLFLPSSNSSSSNTPRSSQNSGSVGGSGEDAGSDGSGDGSTGSSGSFGASSGSGSSAGSPGGGGTNSGGYSSEGSGSSASNSLGSGGAGSARGGTTSGGSSETAGNPSGVGSGSGSSGNGSSSGNPSGRSSSNQSGAGSTKQRGSQGRTQGQREQKVVEINRADSALLTTVRGIGPVYASIIIRYRERLGGFFDTRQLKELNLKYLDYDAVAPYLRVDTTFIEKRHIEELTFKELLHHPYLEYEEVSLIFQYERENPREPVTIEQLGEAGILRSAQIKKLSPYFY